MNTDTVIIGELFDLLTKATRDAVWNWDLETDTVWWNEGFYTLFGHDSNGNEQGPESWYDHVHPEDEERVLTTIHQAIDQGGTNWSDEYRFRRADGTYATVYDRGYILHRDGKPVRMVGAMQDISERVALQQAQQESEERLRFALQSAQLGTWDVDPIRGIVTWDDRCKVLFGLSKYNTITYEDTLRYIHSDDRYRVEEAVKWALNPESGGYYQSTYRMIGEDDGELRWIRSMGQTYFTDTGLAYRFSGVSQDITAEVVAREKSDLSEQQARLAIEGSGSGSFVIDLSTDEIIYSPAFARILTGEATPGLTRNVFINYVHPEDRRVREQAYDAGANTGTISYEIRFIWKDSSIHWVKVLGQYIYDTVGKPVSFSGIALDVTEQRDKVRALREAEERFSIAFANTSVGMAFTDPYANFTVVNEAYTKLLDYSAKELCTLNSIELTHRDDRELNRKLFEEVAQGKRPFFNLVKRYIRKDNSYRWVQMNVTRLVDAQDKAQSMVIIAYDITESVEADVKLRASERRFRNMVTQAPVAIGILNGHRMIVETANTSMLEIWGKDPSIVGQPLIQALPEIQGQGFLELLEQVYTSGITHYGFETLARLHRKGQLEDAYFNFVYAPVRNDAESVTGVMVIATEVTAQVIAKRALQESEQRFRNLIEEAPVAISLFTGRDMIIELPNEKMLKFWGKGDTVTGKPLREALPEIEGQPFLQILDEIYTTGVEYTAQESRADLVVDGKLDAFYFNFTYKPLRNVDGEIYAIVDMAVDVTEQVLARRAIEESELRFRTLMEAIAQMTWTNTPEGEVNFYNQRWYNYTGLDFEQTKAWGWQAVVHPDDLSHTLEMYKHALTNGTIFVVENRYRRGSDGTYRWHLNRALPIRDEAGQITLWVGTATDIHEQKQLEADLEQQIQARTEQLVASNQDLRRSNENLEKFAYIASHDLQEPLRKIQSFADILKTQYVDQLGAGVDYLERMQTAASRMSLLIKDLLAFSRISTRQERVTPVSLSNVVDEVLEDLELTIQRVGAQIKVDTLPTISGDALQLRQLFQNLLSNALKFQKPDGTPVIQIHIENVSANTLPTSIKPTRLVAMYYRISVSDNGIGFDEKYIDRIFQVFQRLHGRSEYAGTGIGLAICEKVVANHGGAITAISQLGQGATFIIYLPIE